jgi:hypothetical protein
MSLKEVEREGRKRRYDKVKYTLGRRSFIFIVKSKFCRAAVSHPASFIIKSMCGAAGTAELYTLGDNVWQ